MKTLVSNKRGGSEILYFRLIGTLIAALVIVSMGFFIRDKASLEGLKKDVIAKDLALAITSIYAAPGDVTYVFYVMKGEYEVKIGDSLVEVASPDGNAPHRYWYAEDENIDGPELDADHPEQIVIKKRGDRITADYKRRPYNEDEGN